jgi:hypothetical protein
VGEKIGPGSLDVRIGPFLKCESKIPDLIRDVLARV